MSNLPLFDPPPVATTTVDVDGAARRLPSIRATTWCSKPPPARGRPPSWCTATSTSSRPGSSRRTSSPSPSRARPRPRCASGSSASCGPRRRARSSTRRAGWRLRDRISEIAISTIDAFCLSLLREFPLEADLDPGFDMADETEVPRFIEESLDRSLRIFGAHGERGSRHRAGDRAARCVADAGRAGVAARSPPGRVGGARPLPDARSEGPEGGRRLPPRRRRSARHPSATRPEGSRSSWPTARRCIRATSCSCARCSGCRRPTA